MVFRKRHRPEPQAATPTILDAYTHEPPSAQLAVDLFAGEWSTVLPPEVGATAGGIGLYADPRIEFFIERAGGVDGKRVVELGPLEASHTYMFERAGADVVAVESNSRAYLKCLIVKELVPLVRSRFLYGDYVGYLEATDERFDLLAASGVLYHAPDPVRSLQAMARVADSIGIWTHYFDQAVMDANDGFARLFDPPHRDGEMTMHRRKYLEALDSPGFCGGPETTAVWMELPDLLRTLGELGFGDIAIAKDDHDHPHGPNVLLHARRQVDV